jgi:hypothetical protein
MIKPLTYLFILLSIISKTQIVPEKENQMQQSLPRQGIHEFDHGGIERK